MEKISTNLLGQLDKHMHVLEALSGYLKTSIREGLCREIIDDILNTLEMHCFYAFQKEESFMLIFNYPMLTRDRNQHEQFHRKLITLKQRLIDTKDSDHRQDIDCRQHELTVEVEKLISDWLKGHVAKEHEEFRTFCINSTPWIQGSQRLQNQHPHMH